MVASRASSASASASVPERYPQEAASSAVISDVPMPRHSSCQCGLFPKRKLKRGCLEQHPHKSELKSVLKSVSLAFSSWSGCLSLRSYASPSAIHSLPPPQAPAAALALMVPNTRGNEAALLWHLPPLPLAPQAMCVGNTCKHGPETWVPLRLQQPFLWQMLLLLPL